MGGRVRNHNGKGVGNHVEVDKKIGDESNRERGDADRKRKAEKKPGESPHEIRVN